MRTMFSMFRWMQSSIGLLRIFRFGLGIACWLPMSCDDPGVAAEAGVAGAIGAAGVAGVPGAGGLVETWLFWDIACTQSKLIHGFYFIKI